MKLCSASERLPLWHSCARPAHRVRPIRLYAKNGRPFARTKAPVSRLAAADDFFRRRSIICAHCWPRICPYSAPSVACYATRTHWPPDQCSADGHDRGQSFCPRSSAERARQTAAQPLGVPAESIWRSHSIEACQILLPPLDIGRGWHCTRQEVALAVARVARVMMTMIISLFGLREPRAVIREIPPSARSDFQF